MSSEQDWHIVGAKYYLIVLYEKFLLILFQQHDDVFLAVLLHNFPNHLNRAQPVFYNPLVRTARAHDRSLQSDHQKPDQQYDVLSVLKPAKSRLARLLIRQMTIIHRVQGLDVQ